MLNFNVRASFTSRLIAGSLIALFLLSIPVAIVSFVRRRGEPANNGVAWLFTAFILACGTTHMMDVPY